MSFVLLGRTPDGKIAALLHGEELLELATLEEVEAAIGSFENLQPDEDVISDWQIVELEI